MAWNHVSLVQLLSKLINGERAVLLSNSRRLMRGLVGWNFVFLVTISSLLLVHNGNEAKRPCSAGAGEIGFISFSFCPSEYQLFKQSAGDRVIMAHGLPVLVCCALFSYGRFHCHIRACYYALSQCGEFLHYYQNKNIFRIAENLSASRVEAICSSPDSLKIPRLASPLGNIRIRSVPCASFLLAIRAQMITEGANAEK